MSINQYPGGIITKNPTSPTTSAAKGIWTVDQAQGYIKQGIWPRSPGAPTIGTATAVTFSTATVAYTAPTDAGTGAVTYTATSSPGGLTGTGASPITVSGLSGSTAYTFSVVGTTPGGTGPASAASNSITTPAAGGQQAFTTAGTFSWVAPSGFTSVSVVAVGGGQGGAKGSGCYIAGVGGMGGSLAYRNNYSVTPGNSYTVVVGAGGAGTNLTNGVSGGDSSFDCTSVLRASGGKPGGGTNAGTASFFGGNGGSTCCQNNGAGGGGAAGYAGVGGFGGSLQNVGGAPASGGAGAGGGGGSGANSSSGGGGGGGVGLLGLGSNGAGGGRSTGGGGGSSGSAGSTQSSGVGGNGGVYGGGGGGGLTSPPTTSQNGGTGGVGAVRIIWPGSTRLFPSTNTGNI